MSADCQTICFFLLKIPFRYIGILLLLCGHLVYAQQPVVSGYLKDKTDGYPLVDATVVLLNLPDSSLAVQPATTDLNGKFTFSYVPKGNKVLKILYVGYKGYISALTFTGDPIDFGIIGMTSNTAEDQVIVTVIRAVTQNGDTTQFSADAFKVNPDATAEDLISKLPGVTSQNGTVQAQGETVGKVLVDGKPFFGDDPATVLKNLPAEVIDKIQVFDQLSDQSQFTGFDDGNRTKTINIVTKPDKRDGNFGKVYAGYGYNDVYRAGGNLNFFKGNRRISILGQSNNINEQNFSADDLLGVSSSSSSNSRGSGSGGSASGGNTGGTLGRPGGSNDNFLVNTQGGVSKTNAVGLNYSDKWGKKWDVSSSYFFNRSNNVAEQSIYRRYVLTTESAQTYNEHTITNTINTNHRFNARLEYKIDSMNSFLITPKFAYQQNNSDRSLFGFTDRGNSEVNSTMNGSGSNQYAINTSNVILFRHKFNKKGRTFSINLNTGYNKTSGKNNFLAQNNYFTNTALSDTLDQHSNVLKNGYSIDSKVSYTEPLSENSILEFMYDLDYTKSASDKRTYNFVPAANDYAQQDTSLSNVFKSIYVTHQGGLGYRYQTKKYQFGANMTYQYAELDNVQQFPRDNTLTRTFSNVLPSARARINFSKTKNMRIDYRTQTTAPSVDQLQNVINNSNPLQLSTGNPGLKQQYQHTLTMRYSATNSEKASNFFVLLSGAYTEAYVANSTYIANTDTTIDGVALTRGAQLSTKQNVDGYISARSFASYGRPMAWIKSNVNVNVSATFTRTPGLINGNVNNANSPSFGGGLVLSSNISQAIDFTLSTNSSYNFVKNTLNTKSDAEYFSQNSKAKLNIILLKHLVLNTDITHQYNAGLSAGFNQNYLLWNAALGYKFLKNNVGEFRLTIFDILNQNKSVSRTFTDIYNQDTRINVLTQYYMLTFTYNFRNYKKKPDKVDSSQ
ncbi:MAG: hypothetical protein JWO58_2290 [Chitinophagaceae bacterium]|nr:hypothetical protein [Chitinophagaceae bacterium]